jgi:hypothetical protein
MRDTPVAAEKKIVLTASRRLWSRRGLRVAGGRLVGGRPQPPAPPARLGDLTSLLDGGTRPL